MKKRFILAFAAISVIFAAALVIGCSNSSGSDNPPAPPVPTKVTLAAGSNGTAADKSVTGLEATGTFIVKMMLPSANAWYSVDAAGAVAMQSDLAAAVTASKPLSEGKTAITGLTNGLTYDVYIVAAGVNEGSYAVKANTVWNVAALADSEYANLTADEDITAKALYVYTNDANVAAVESATLNNQVLGGTMLDFTFSEVTPDNATIAAAGTDTFGLIDLSGLTGATFAAKLTATEVVK